MFIFYNLNICIISFNPHLDLASREPDSTHDCSVFRRRQSPYGTETPVQELKEKSSMGQCPFKLSIHV